MTSPPATAATAAPSPSAAPADEQPSAAAPSDPTRFELDERARAMLAEMGIRVWWPSAAGPAAATFEATSATTSATTSSPRPAAATGQTAVWAKPQPRPATAPTTAAAATAATTASAPGGPRAASNPASGASAQTPVTAAALQTAQACQPLPPGVAQMDWATLQSTVAQCRACPLCAGRKNTVFGTGDTQAQWMVVGEAPGENEDLQGQPFVGQAGQLLDNMLRAIGLDRAAPTPPDPTNPEAHAGENTANTAANPVANAVANAKASQGVYITNTLKCRPPGNRNPEPLELQSCAPYLQRQVALVQPRIILAMGRFAVQSLLQSTEPIGKLRGRVHSYQGVPVVVTYHPAYLLRNPADKAKAWADLCLALLTVQ